jgi:hypothetical protein
MGIIPYNRSKGEKENNIYCEKYYLQFHTIYNFNITEFHTWMTMYTSGKELQFCNLLIFMQKG